MTFTSTALPLKLKEVLFFLTAMKGASGASSSKVPTKARSFPLPGTGNQSRVSSLILHLKDSSPGFENCGLQIYDLKGRGEIDNCKLSEATSLRGDPGSSCQSPGLGCNKQEIFLVV
jgi:hypothetical protein